MNTAENEKEVSILGFRNVKLNNVNNFLREVRGNLRPSAVQLVDASRVAGKPHILFAFLCAKKSLEQGRAICVNIEMETLVSASGQRQINRAIDMLGIKTQTSNIAAILFASDEEKLKEAEIELIKLVPGIRDDSVLEVKNKEKVGDLIRIFGVTESEIKLMTQSGIAINEALTWLIVERVALVSVKH